VARPRAPILLALAALALAAGAYARVLRGPFQFDDGNGIATNPAVRAGLAWLKTGFLGELAAGGRPLTTLSFGLNHAVGGLDPFGYHLVNLALHLAVVLLLGALTLRLARAAGAPRPEWIALGACALFAVHPVHSQAVSYVSQRAEVLASALYVATLLLLLRGRDAAGPGARWGWRGAAAGALALGLAAKAIVVTAPVAWLLLLAALPRAAEGEPSVPEPVRRAWLGALPLAALAAAFAAVTLLALRGRPDAGLDTATTTPLRYLATQAGVLVVYLRLLAWPAGQCVDWVYPSSPGFSDPATLGAAALVAALAGAGAWLVVRGRRSGGPGGARARLAGVGLLWFLLVLSVTSSVVPLADNLMEHRLYLASWGIFLAAACGADALADRLGTPRAIVLGGAIVVLALAAALWSRNAVWLSAEALWADVLRKTPDSARARLGLGVALQDAGRLDEAREQYERGLRTVGRYEGVRAQLLRNLGAAELQAGRFEEARRAFARGLEVAPRDADLLANMAALAFAGGDLAAAEHYGRRAVDARSDQPVALNVLGTVALERDEFAAALALLDRAVAADPARGEFQMNRATALGLLGRRGEECSALRAALRSALGARDRAEVERRLGAGCP
jgi:tetratricopeptide (TPR) repeat protein